MSTQTVSYDDILDNDNASARALVSAVDQRYRHLMSCKQRNINECKRCNTYYQQLRHAADQAEDDGINVKFAEILNRSSVMYETPNK